MSPSKKIRNYEKRRDLENSGEPRGRSTGSRSGRLFLVQAHDASNMHYDFRIEIEGVLESWAVPKGLSTDPREKRLAIPTEPHPVEYADFEGTIPEGEYGAGTVQVWDRGEYHNLKEDEAGEEVPMAECLKDGHITVWLEGKKVAGGYALTRSGRKDNWLLVKMDDDEADARRNPVRTEKRSVASGRTINEIRNDQE